MPRRAPARHLPLESGEPGECVVLQRDTLKRLKVGVPGMTRLRARRWMFLAMLLCGCAATPGWRLVLPAGSGECRTPLRL